MATKITVAVGANGEISRARSLRDGARADRLDSEATRQQVKDAAGELLDGDATGRDNEKSKYGPSRDPAAHARKKKVDGKFIGLSIRFDHYPLNVPWTQAKDYPYMHIFVRGITPEGQIKEPVKIELTRNLRTETFRVEPPAEYTRDNFMAPSYLPGDGPWGLDIWPQSYSEFNFSKEPYTSNERLKYPVTPGATTQDRNAFASARYNWWEFREISVGVMPAFNETTLYDVFWHVQNPDQKSYEPILTGYPEQSYDNNNTRQNGRTELDATVTGYTNFDKDPVHELFMLPLTGNKCFLLVIFTDYMIQTATGVKQVAKAVSGEGSTYNNISINGKTQTMYTNSVLYSREDPIYELPDGFAFEGDSEGPWTGSGPRIKVTEAGSNKIQTIKLYSVEDGVVTEVENVPEELRTKAGNLSASLKDFALDPIEKYENYMSYDELHSCYYDTRFTQDFRLQVQVFDGSTTDSFSAVEPEATMTRQSSILNHIRASRKYLDDEAVARSIVKGFGMGRLSTGNHFDSLYANLQSKSFADDYFFTPIVYEYLKGTASPSVLYSSAKPPGVVPSEFVDYDGNEQVRFSTQQPTTVKATHSGPYGPWIDAPALKNSTHRCWNWNKPGHCWDELNALGFGSDLIGARPTGE